MRWFSLALLALVGSVSANDVIFVGQTHGNGTVNVHDAYTGSLLRSSLIFGSSFSGGVNVAAGDVNGDGHPDLVVGAGPGAGPHVRVFDGVSGTQLKAYFAFDPTFKGGVNVAAGDVNGDGYDDVICGSGPGMPARIRVFDGLTNAMTFDQPTSYAQSFAAWWDFAFNGGTGKFVMGSSSKVSVFSLAGVETNFFTPYSGFAGGVFVATGDLNGDGYPDIVTSNSTTAPPRVTSFNGKNLLQLVNFQPFPPAYTGGVSISTGNFDNDADDDFLCGTFGSLSLVYCFDGTTGNPMGSIFQPFGPSYNGGVTVAYGTDIPGNQILIKDLLPNDAVPITVWTPDLRHHGNCATPFTRLYDPGTVQFTAPQNAGTPGQYFTSWTIDGTTVGGGARTIGVNTNAPHTIIPNYAPGRTLHVGSTNPTTGVPITIYTPDENGLKSGTTAFDRIYTQGTSVGLSAPLTFSGNRYFMRWDLDGAPWLSTPSVSVPISSANRNLNAVYGTGFNVNVSANQPSVPITVYTRDKNLLTNGITPFSRLYAPGTNAAFTAPAAAGGVPFKYWILNGVNQPVGKRTVSVTTNAVIDIAGYFAP